MFEQRHTVETCGSHGWKTECASEQVNLLFERNEHTDRIGATHQEIFKIKVRSKLDG